jgi:hypothetical protein
MQSTDARPARENDHGNILTSASLHPAEAYQPADIFGINGGFRRAFSHSFPQPLDEVAIPTNLFALDLEMPSTPTSITHRQL